MTDYGLVASVGQGYMGNSVAFGATRNPMQTANSARQQGVPCKMPANSDPCHAASGPVELTSCELAKHLPHVAWLAGVPWSTSERVLRPLSMPHVSIDVDRAQLREVMSQHGAVLATWTTDWDMPGVSEWWWVCCDDPNYQVDLVKSSRGRRDIRKGLRECEVRRVDRHEFGRLAYPIYSAAARSYGRTPPTEESFVRGASSTTYPGIEFWGAFCHDRLAAFSTCRVVDNAVSLANARSDPDLEKHDPNAALFYGICRHYMENGLRYVTNGSRTLWHPTRINDLLEKLGFLKVYCRVNVEVSPVVRIIDRLRVAAWGRYVGLPWLFRRRWMQLEACHRLLRIAETF